MVVRKLPSTLNQLMCVMRLSVLLWAHHLAYINKMKCQLGFGLLLCWVHQVGFAQTDLVSAEKHHQISSTVNLLQSGDGEWRLQAKEADLPQLLDKIAEQAKLRVHYSVLPAATVTATCIGVNVVELLQCVFNGSANIVSRKATSQSKQDEIWVMSSSLAGANTVVSASCQSALAIATGSEVNDRAEQWLKQAKSKDVEQRAQAIAELKQLDAAYDAKVRGVLQNALSDKQPKVRARAIAAFTGREGEMAATEQLRKALQDSNSDVRMSAIDMIEKDEALLQMAAQNSDQSVREIARLKLDLLTQAQ